MSAFCIATRSSSNSMQSNQVLNQLLKDNPGKAIALLSDSNSFHTTLLKRFVSEKIGPCTLLSSRDKIPDNIALIFIDCLSVSTEELSNVLREVSVLSEDIATALLNADKNDEHESLLDWPCVSGVFYMDTSEDQLLRGSRKLLEGDYWVPRRLLHHFFNKHRQNSGKSQVSPISSIQLTGREKEILRMIKDGMSNSAVSESLDLSEHTVKSHLYNIYKKIGVRNRMEASNWARDQQSLLL